MVKRVLGPEMFGRLCVCVLLFVRITLWVTGTCKFPNIHYRVTSSYHLVPHKNMFIYHPIHSCYCGQSLQLLTFQQTCISKVYQLLPPIAS